MMKYWPLILSLLIMLAAFQPASADFYRYKDKHGNIMYTDDLSKVPADQRDQVQSYEESSGTPPVSADQGEQKSSTQAEGKNDNQKAYEQLKQKQETLRSEYDGLKAEYDKLKKAEQEAVTPAQRKAHNKQVEEFNARFQAYEKKRDALAAEIDAYDKKANEKQAAEKKQ